VLLDLLLVLKTQLTQTLDARPPSSKS
jgi:hypothetical protein